MVDQELEGLVHLSWCCAAEGQRNGVATARTSPVGIQLQDERLGVEGDLQAIARQLGVNLLGVTPGEL